VLQGQAQLGKLPSVGSKSLDGKTVWAALKESVLANFGDTGWGAVGSSLTGELSVEFRRVGPLFIAPTQ